jgi:hypothetical protein
MVITLLILFPLIIAVTGFLVLKGVQLGLRWQLQTKQERPPTMESPIAPIMEKVEQRQAEKQQEEIKSLYSEWMNGAEESR